MSFASCFRERDSRLILFIPSLFSGVCRQIGRLKKLVGRKGFSNNPAAEISDVMKLFEEDMAGLQRDIASLQRCVDNSFYLEGLHQAVAPFFCVACVNTDCDLLTDDRTTVPAPEQKRNTFFGSRFASEEDTGREKKGMCVRRV